MAAPSTRTLITSTSTLCTRCHLRLPSQTLRHFSTSPPSHASDTPDAAISAISNLSSSIARNPNRTPSTSTTTTPRPGGYLAQLDRPAFLDDDDENSILTGSMRENLNNASSVGEKAHRLHVYATKHNTHLTLVQPSRPASASTLTGSPSGKNTANTKMIDVLMSYSAGNVGFRKAGRGSYDAAYQLATFLFKQMGEKGLLVEKGIKGGIQDLEIVLRGFGAGREAVTKVLLGSEGRNVRGRVRRVVDATRLKLGGPRAKKPRRLG
ncbi:hypothetical protein LTR56_002060 [Elasticomyces elasticus]|nr:hypothetical protein LTR22_012202 [Elasticomyces elasticus]KAK3658203.1 hypothetical protein LTR56_002060 [Elasticomyces elasticus]KAK4919482.1 hypothetical protein LTR49_012860 [Elasticomyces elasticus]KAK5764088.1 hypothetical protein LTS12_005782 [Elasticomyces elasticus]